MNKITRKIVSALCAAVVLSSSAFAMELNYYGENTSLSVSTDVRNKLHFTGKVDGNFSNRMATVFIMKPGKTLADTSDTACVEYMNTAEVDFNGNFEFEFNFEKESGTYPVFVLCGDEVYSHNYNYKSWTDIVSLFEKIRNDSVTYTDISDCAETLGLDLSVVTKDGYKATVITRLSQKKGSITDGNESVDVIKTVLKNCKEEFIALERIRSAGNWSELPAILNKITELTGVVYNYRGASQQRVCQKLIGKEFTSAELLKADFDKAVTEVLSEAGNGGGGGNGGGNGGSKVTGGGSNGNYLTGDYIPTAPQNTENENSNAFTDISDIEWAVKPINYLYTKGVISGTGDGKFSPNDLLKREEIAKIIVNAFGLLDEAAETDFKDTSSDLWHFRYIASAKAKGVVKGISETEFGVGQYVTRQDIAVMIYNAAIMSGKGFTKTKTDFTDYAEIADYAKEAVAGLGGAGVIGGMEDGSFAPTANATRAQAAKMIYAVISE